MNAPAFKLGGVHHVAYLSTPETKCIGTPE